MSNTELIYIIRSRETGAICSVSFSARDAWERLALKYVDEKDGYFISTYYITMPEHYSKLTIREEEDA